MTLERMNNLAHQVTFSPQISAEQVPLIAEKGYKTVICNRPDNEEEGQPTSASVAEACKQAGLVFKEVSYSGGNLTQENLEIFAEFFKNNEQPVYMYCRSGNRSKMMYQAAIQMNLL